MAFNRKEKGSSVDVYQMVTDRILQALEQGKIPWSKPWVGVDGSAQKNLVSGKEYQGVNTILLSMCAPNEEYFLSFKQVREKGGTVKSGSKGIPVVYWNFIDLADKDSTNKAKTKRVGFLKYYTVFALKDCDGIDRPVSGKDTYSEFEAVEGVQDLLHQAEINHVARDKASYSPSRDVITLPMLDQFKSSEDYYSTAFHELVHWTGHSSRLNRFAEGEKVAAFGTETYSKEELTAEIGSAYLTAQLRFNTAKIEQNNVAYIQGWLTVLRNDKKFIVSAASKAVKAVKYIKGERATPEAA